MKYLEISIREVMWWSVISLTVGVCATVAVAWIAAARCSSDADIAIERFNVYQEEYFDDGHVGCRRITYLELFGNSWATGHIGDMPCVDALQTTEELPSWLPDGFARGDMFDSDYVKASGWPFRAMRATIANDDETNFYYETSLSMNGIALPGAEENRYDLGLYRVLPLGIIPLGFLGNALITASVMFVAVMTMKVARRQYRIACGQCAACGYALFSKQRCPECGWGK